MKIILSRGKERKVGSDDPMNARELAQYEGLSESTIHAAKRAGYRFQFGHRTTSGHFRAWQASRAGSVISGSSETESALERQLSELR